MGNNLSEKRKQVRDEVVEQLKINGEDTILSTCIRNIHDWKIVQKLDLSFTDIIACDELINAVNQSDENKEALANSFYVSTGIAFSGVSISSNRERQNTAIDEQIGEIIKKSTFPRWTPLGFGKHPGSTFPRIAMTDPIWFFNSEAAGTFDGLQEPLASQFQDVSSKVRAFRIPQTDKTEKLVAQIFIHPFSFDFARFDIVPESRQWHVGASPTERCDFLNMGRVFELNPLDRIGFQQWLKDFRTQVLGHKTSHIQMDFWEKFFEDESNFYEKRDRNSWL